MYFIGLKLLILKSLQSAHRNNHDAFDRADNVKVSDPVASRNNKRGEL